MPIHRHQFETSLCRYLFTTRQQRIICHVPYKNSEPLYFPFHTNSVRTFGFSAHCCYTTGSDTSYDRFDNMRFYYRVLSPEFKRKNDNKWVIVDRCKVLAVFGADDPVMLEDFLDQCTMEAFVQQVGHERSPSPSAEVLPLDWDAELASKRKMILTDLRGSTDEKLLLEYHPQEGEVIDAKDFEPRIYFSGSRTCTRRVIVWLLLQSKSMVQSGKGVPATFIVQTGCPYMKLHNELFDTLQCEIDATKSMLPSQFVADHMSWFANTSQTILILRVSTFVASKLFFNWDCTSTQGMIPHCCM